MPWKRGNRDTDTELANVQSWVESADPILFGKNGDPGVIRLFYDDRAKKEQRDNDLMALVKFIAWFVGSLSGLSLLTALANLYFHITGK